MTSLFLRRQPHHFVDERFRWLFDEFAPVYDPVADLLQQTAGRYSGSAERYSGVCQYPIPHPPPVYLYNIEEHWIPCRLPLCSLPL